MKRPNTLIFSGYGINCEEETKFAFDSAGANTDIVHVNDLIRNKKLLNKYQILAFPGGFSYGDDTGAGNAYANKIKNNLSNELNVFIKKGGLVIGICNGFQILSNLGLLPALKREYGKRQAALTSNNNARYTVRFTDLKVENDSPWLKNIKFLSAPIAHGEGKFFVEDNILRDLKKKNMIALRYYPGETANYQSLDKNPNGSLDDIAAITDESGLILGMMPHPERAMFMHQLPHFQLLKEISKTQKITLPHEGPGMQIFKNAVEYFNK